MRVDVAKLVQADIEARACLGEGKYGERLQTHNGRRGLQDAYEEALDLCMYLRQVLEERANAKECANLQAHNSSSHEMPDYLELLSTIDDSRLTVMDGKEYVRVGTRLMYDSLARHFGH